MLLKQSLSLCREIGSERRRVGTMPQATAFNHWLKSRRTALDLTQWDLAERVGCSREAIQKIEAGTRRPSKQIAELLIACLEIPLEERAAFVRWARRRTIHPRALGAPENNLPSPLLVRSPGYHLPSPVTPLLGRAAELADLDRLLSDPDCRLISIVGPGGIGKTRLAIAAAAEKELEFKDGVFFISLASLGSADLLAPTLLATIGASLQGQRDCGQQLINYLREREVLLVLDNMEHLLEGTQLLADLLRRAPCVALLVTSRERLNLQGEWVLDLHGLEVPEEEQVEEVERYSAVQLFLQNAQRSRAGSSFSDEEESTIVRICRMVEGMPLAIELAAAWARTLSCRQIADEMEKSFGFLTTALRDVPQRHRSMRAVFEHSWNLLNAEERGALRRLAVFQGGFQKEAAEQVAAASLPLLAALVDKSLVRSTHPEWYDLHHLVRQFAHEFLVEARESEETHRRYAEYYLALVERAEPELTTSSQTQWFNQLNIEHANIRAVLAWSREHNVELGLKLCGSIWRFWEWHNFIGEGRAWLETFIAQSPLPTAARGKALHAASALAIYQGDYEAAGVHMEEALSIFQQLGNRRGIAAALNELGAVAVGCGRLADARQRFEQSLAIKRELGDDWLIANSVGNLGLIAGYQNDYASAYTLQQESLTLSRAMNETGGIAIASGNLGHAAMHLGRLEEAQARQAESLRLFDEIGDKNGLTECLERFAMLANATANFKRAAQLFGAASALRKETGTSLLPVERAEYDRELRATRAQMDTATFDAEWRAGQMLTLEQAIGLALSEAVGPPIYHAEEETA